MNIKIGDKVRIKSDLKKGMGVCAEQVAYAGQEFTVVDKWGYDGVILKDNHFDWNISNLEVIN